MVIAYPLHQYQIVELFTTATILIAQAGDLASTLEVALKRFRNLKKVFE